MSHKIILWMLITLAIGCGGKPQRRVFFDSVPKNEIVSFSTPAELRLAFMRPDGNKARYCAEPMPDVALGSTMSAAGSLSASGALSKAASVNASLAQENEQLRDQLGKAVDAYERETRNSYRASLSRSGSASSQMSASGSLNLAAAANLAVTVSELGGRSHQVLLAREFLYRLCEARANNFITKEENYIALEIQALDMIQNIYASQRASNAAEDALANAELLKQVNEYNGTRLKLCDVKKESCLQQASDAAKKQACGDEHKKCVDGISLLKLQDATPRSEQKPRSLSEQMQDAVKQLVSPTSPLAPPAVAPPPL